MCKVSDEIESMFELGLPLNGNPDSWHPAPIDLESLNDLVPPADEQGPIAD
jgi:hypothetical protein